jgi:DNA-binding response OmpR family regulator
MPARVVVILDEPGFAVQVAAAINADGYDAIPLGDSMEGLEALREAHLIELLITSPNFPSGMPNGISLALMARSRRPGLKVLFLGSSEMERYTAGVGTLLTPPLTVAEVVIKAAEMLDPDG